MSSETEAKLISSPMKFLLTMDSMKECLSSKEANEALRMGIREVSSIADIDEITMSDGGEGFLDAMKPQKIVKCYAHDAMMRPIIAEYGVTDSTAIIESARVLGLSMIEPELRNVLIATSFGLGEVIFDAWEHGYTDLIVGIGGTATSDCGIGMINALKKRIFQKKRIPTGYPFDITVLQQLHVTLATDVKSPLLGAKGAAHVFAPQKGATPQMVELLERKAHTFAEMAAKHMGYDNSEKPGAGAGGGLGYAFLQFTDATVKPGAIVVCEKNHLEQKIQEGDIVITGEGHSDQQTLMGKLPQIILNYAVAHNAHTYLVAGKIDDRDALVNNGFNNIIDINEGMSEVQNPLDKEIAKQRLRATAMRIAKEYLQ